MSGDGGLARALARRDHRQLRAPERELGVAGRLEVQAGRLVVEAEVKGQGGQALARLRPQDRFVGQVDHRTGARSGRQAADRRGRFLAARHPAAVVLLWGVEDARPHLLLAAAEHDPGQRSPGLQLVEGVANRGGKVLPVDEGDRRTRRHATILATGPPRWRVRRPEPRGNDAPGWRACLPICLQCKRAIPHSFSRCWPERPLLAGNTYPVC